MGYARFATFAALLAFAPEVVSAQTIPSPFRFIETSHEVGLYAGYLAIDPGELDVAPKPAPLLGARYNLHFTGPLSGEVGLGFVPTNRDVKKRVGTDATLTDVEEISSLLLMGEAGLRFHFTGARAWNGLAPYALATGGFVVDLASTGTLEQQIPDAERFSFGPSFAASLGLGSQFFLTDRLSLRGEVRDYLWRLAYPASYGGLLEKDNEWANNFGLTIGGSIHF